MNIHIYINNRTDSKIIYNQKTTYAAQFRIKLQLITRGSIG